MFGHIGISDTCQHISQWIRNRHYLSPPYQLDLTTPGRSPLRARVLKHIRQMPNFLKNALGRPQIGHLEYARVLNRGLRFAFTIKDFFAKHASFLSS
jgi:hypothetical protein